MRIYLQLSRNTQLIPFNYHQYLAGAIHKWLGKNGEHGQISLYSFSWIQNTKSTAKGIHLSPASYFFFSAHDELLLKKLLRGIRTDPEWAFGSRVTEVQILPDKTFSNRERFTTASPVFIKRKGENNKEKHFTYEDQQCDLLLTETLKHKLQVAGISTEGVKIYFDRTYTKAKAKLSRYRSIHHKVSVCPVIIEGSPQQISLAWNSGIGNSTGIGYGALS
ncbi:CRISPR-associated endoribonuclease Cas6 [Chitinophaga defluvii]|uniref:CRISPR-associated endoribonuclease Cas6 n=1 Tax=Chitinophaga defluvii TaxID=3163343 RepID=A0ABV2T7R1_9BACT